MSTAGGCEPNLLTGVELSLLSAAADPDRPLAGLDDAQRRAVTHSEPRLVVCGAAGTGKTCVVERRFEWLVARGCPPERIGLVVPSEARAAALRARLEERLTVGYEELLVLTPAQLAARTLRGAGAVGEPFESVLSPGDRLAMLVERIDELTLAHHDFGGRPTVLLGGFVRRIDRLKAELISARRYADWAASLPEAGPGPAAAPGPAAGPDAPAVPRPPDSPAAPRPPHAPAAPRPPDSPAAPAAADVAREREFAAIYLAHERMLQEAGARDDGALMIDALTLAHRQPALIRRFEHVLVDDAQELDRAGAELVAEVTGATLTVAGDPDGALRRGRSGGAARMRGFAAAPGARTVVLERTRRCPERVWTAAQAALGADGGGSGAPAPGGEVELWRCANERSQAQAVAVDIERLLARLGERSGRIAVLVPEIAHEGQAVGVALEERAIAHRLVGEAAFFQRAEIRDVLAWLRLLADPTDAGAVVRALARPPIELRSVDIARCTQIARRRKLDMVSALAAAIEAPQVPPEARERIRVFLKLHRAGTAGIDTTRPDVYVHRLIERLGLRRQQLFTAQADVVERLRALAAFGRLAAAFVGRSPQSTPREFARSIAAVADFGLREQEEPDLTGGGVVQVLTLEAAGGLEADHVYVLGLHAGLAVPAFEPVPEALRSGAEDGGEADPAGEGGADEAGEGGADEAGEGGADEAGGRAALRGWLYVALSRASERLVLAYPRADDRGTPLAPAPELEAVRAALGAGWQDREEELFGPAETLHSTYRLLRDELLEGTARAGSRLGELRFDTDLDISHAVVRYLELLKLAALIARPEGQSVAESLRDVNARILQAVTAEQREIFESSALDDYLLDAERDARRRAQALVARDEPSLQPFLPLRGDGVVLSASDIDTYRTCPLKYKFARVFRIPQEPTLHQRFGILVHQVLERYHAAESDSLPELLGLLEAGWRRGGFGDSEEERQLRGKAASALTRYHERFRTEDARPVWFERQFQFKLGRHLLRGRVDRVDRLPGGEYELIDYKTGRPKSAGQLAQDVQLSLYAVGARESWQLEASRQAYYYLLDDEKVAVPDDSGDRGEWVREVATEVAEGILSQGFEPTPSFGACSICDYRLVCPAAER